MPPTRADGHVGSHGSDLRLDPGGLRGRRRGGPVRALLRFLQAGHPDGGRRRASRHASAAGLELRSGRALGGDHETNARAVAQHAAQSDREGLFPRGAGTSRRALPRARPAVHHRRGLRAPRLRRRARPDGVAPRNARAHDHDLELRKDLLPDGLEDRLGGGAAGPDRGGARRAPVHHLRHGHPAPARRGRGLSAGPSTTSGSRPTTAAKRDFLSDELSRLGFGVRRPAGTYFVCADFRAFGSRTTSPSAATCSRRPGWPRFRRPSSTTTRRTRGDTRGSRSASARRLFGRPSGGWKDCGGSPAGRGAWTSSESRSRRSSSRSSSASSAGAHSATGRRPRSPARCSSGSR